MTSVNNIRGFKNSAHHDGWIEFIFGQKMVIDACLPSVFMESLYLTASDSIDKKFQILLKNSILLIYVQENKCNPTGVEAVTKHQ